MKRLCKLCGKSFSPNIWNQVLCGSRKNQVGCSWLNVNEIRNKRRWQTKGYKEYQRDYGKNWKQIQRRLNSEYAKRQRELKKAYYQTEKGKAERNEWRRRNIDKVLFWNKKRALRKKGIVGSHTLKEWLELKKEYKYRCALCGIFEEELERKWASSHFTKLTEDHIIPIVRRGTDYISNIQPLCISCNAKKKDA